MQIESRLYEAINSRKRILQKSIKPDADVSLGKAGDGEIFYAEQDYEKYRMYFSIIDGRNIFCGFLNQRTE